jgi:peptidoglycan-associated lipoprotein
MENLMRKYFGTLLISGLALAAGCKKEVPPPAPPTPAIVEVAPEPEPEPEPEPVVVVEDFERVFFGYNSTDLDAPAKSSLVHNADLLNKYDNVTIRVQGHADERGTTEYNLHLGQRRAQRVQDYLVNQGVSPKKIQLISYGEEMPLLQAPDEGEYAFSKNRRAEFQVTSGNRNPVRGTTKQ